MPGELVILNEQCKQGKYLLKSLTFKSKSCII